MMKESTHDKDIIIHMNSGHKKLSKYTKHKMTQRTTRPIHNYSLWLQS